jgi:ubiquinone/menaquinone biosynthesis C-methylase UbiE
MTHSEQFLTDDRDRWWSAVQLHAIAKELDLDRVRTAVDMGCGHGHWTRVVASVLPAEAALIGVDREPAWIARASSRDSRARYVIGTAEALPFADASVDLVTAQTLLVHVADPRVVLREAARVLRPRGRLWLIEPNNLNAPHRDMRCTARPRCPRPRADSSPHPSSPG